MMDIFREWIQNVVVFLLLMTMAGQLIPEEKYRKYIHLTMGLLLILVILLPLTKLTGMDEKLYQNFIRESFRISAADARAGESIVGKEGQFADGYRQMIQEEVRLYFEANAMVMKYCDLDMDSDVESENYGQIYEMRVGIVPKDRNMEESGPPKEIEQEREISIGEIQVGKGKGGTIPNNSEIQKSSLPEEKIEQWKKDISLQFGIEEEQLELEILS
ncbi:stage III sporulation protein AF [Frisingicoccus sp.]|uniref:stage III sporulation protein AF n=1 Tax=Frisingicoccus sp. TaxID=1918627 RepID=UPI003AB3D61B